MDEVGTPPVEEHFRRSQTPESPRPVHIPELSNIPVLLNQMDPVFNDTTTYNIPIDLKSPPKTSESSDDVPLQVKDANILHTFFNGTEQTDPTATNGVDTQGTPAGHSDQTATIEIPHSLTAGLPDKASAQPEEQSVKEDHSALDASILDTTIPEAEPASVNDTLPTDQELLVSQNESATLAGQPDQSIDEGVDLESLLNNIAQSASTAPTTDTIPALSIDQTPTSAAPSALPSFPGLPAKPSFNSAPQSSNTAMTQNPSIANSEIDPTQALISAAQSDGTSAPSMNSDGMIYFPSSNQASVMAVLQDQQSVPGQAPSIPGDDEVDPADRPWTPRTQSEFDQFLEDERRYVTEGIWDRFPVGSRLFVGNLPSEKVTKRDLFHKFHKHGKLAQISIKQAYGFVQYHTAEACMAALMVEQNIELRGRKVHLEISKPQKNTKGSGSKNNSNNNQNRENNRRRSRSPQRKTYSDFRDEPSRQNYRSRRSPSPPRYRRDDRNNRNDRRSPVSSVNGYSNSNNLSAYGTPSYDDDSSLPWPRRHPRDVPDAQVIVLDSGVQQTFINWIEDSMRRKGLRSGTLYLDTRTSIQAVVKRQILEGVTAVIKLGNSAQARSKIPLQVFDRSGGGDNVSFNEYIDLDPNIAADVIVQARQKFFTQPQYPPSVQPPMPNTQYRLPQQQSQPQSQYQQPGQNIYASQHNAYQSAPQAQAQQSAYQYQQPQQQQAQQAQQQRYGVPPPPFPPQVPQQQPQYQTQQYSTPQAAAQQPPNLQDLLANLKSAGSGGQVGPPTPVSQYGATQQGQQQQMYGQQQQQQQQQQQAQQWYGQYQR